MTLLTLEIGAIAKKTQLIMKNSITNCLIFSLSEYLVSLGFPFNSSI